MKAPEALQAPHLLNLGYIRVILGLCRGHIRVILGTLSLTTDLKSQQSCPTI